MFLWLPCRELVRQFSSSQWSLDEVKELGISSFDSQLCLIQRESLGVGWGGTEENACLFRLQLPVCHCLYYTRGHWGCLRFVSQRFGFVLSRGWAPRQRRGKPDWEICARGSSVCRFSRVPTWGFPYLQLVGEFFPLKKFWQLFAIFYENWNMSYFVPLIGSDQTRTVIRGRMAKEGSSERRVRGSFPWVEVSLGRVHCLTGHHVQCLPICPLHGRKSMGTVHCVFRKRNAFSERAWSISQGRQVQEQSQECRSVGNPWLCLGNSCILEIVCFLTFTSHPGLLPVI